MLQWYDQSASRGGSLFTMNKLLNLQNKKKMVVPNESLAILQNNSNWKRINNNIKGIAKICTDGLAQKIIGFWFTYKQIRQEKSKSVVLIGWEKKGCIHIWKSIAARPKPDFHWKSINMNIWRVSRGKKNTNTHNTPTLILTCMQTHRH